MDFLPTNYSALSMPGGRHLYTCTFCRQISSGPPQVLGRSARLVCPPCHSALLDLSICWVCGEMIFRGEECVSLGWCFWHRACYGCLLCGSRLICKGVRISALYENDAAGTCASAVTVGWEQGRCCGREVAEVPLCAVCVVESEMDGLGEEAVMQRGLRRIDRFDGGVTRRRKRRREQMLGSMNRAREPSILERRAQMGADGTACDEPVYEHAEMEKVVTSCSLGSAIWVNIFDPVDGRSFRPSPLKPIPMFMECPEQNRHRRDGFLSFRAPSAPHFTTPSHIIPGPHLMMPPGPPSSPRPAPSPCLSPPRRVCPSPQQPAYSQTSLTPARSTTKSASPSIHSSLRESGGLAPLLPRHRTLLTSEEHLKRPSSSLRLCRPGTDICSSVYWTPPGSPKEGIEQSRVFSTVECNESNIHGSAQRLSQLLRSAPPEIPPRKMASIVTMPVPQLRPPDRVGHTADGQLDTCFNHIRGLKSSEQGSHRVTGEKGRSHVRSVGLELRKLLVGR